MYLFVLVLLIIVLTTIIVSTYSPIGLVDLIPFIRPKKSFPNIRHGKINYSSSKNWFKLPEENQDPLVNADIFFVHRTTYLSNTQWNASIANKALNWITYRFSVSIQIKIFKGIARAYVPKYRQATLYSFYDKNDNGANALNLAYLDVKEAFLYYLNHHNNGRPIILAGHSQGTHHLERLLKELFDNNQVLRQKLVCAYLISMPIKKNAFENIPACSGEEDTSCYMSWSTFGENATPLYFKGQYDDALCTNPLNWKSNNPNKVDQSHHKGSVTYYMNIKHKQRIYAYCGNGILHINDPKLGYFRLRKRDYVTMDYHLYYENIRKNIKVRIKNYYKILQ